MLTAVLLITLSQQGIIIIISLHFGADYYNVHTEERNWENTAQASTRPWHRRDELYPTRKSFSLDYRIVVLYKLQI